jgi:hypothetical protein
VNRTSGHGLPYFRARFTVLPGTYNRTSGHEF